MITYNSQDRPSDLSVQLLIKLLKLPLYETLLDKLLLHEILVS